jgi:hypothetical protein
MLMCLHDVSVGLINADIMFAAAAHIVKPQSVLLSAI